MKRGKTSLIFIGLVILISVLIFFFSQRKEIFTKDMENNENKQVSDEIKNNNEVDFQKYNYQFVEGEEIEKILDNLIGENGKLAFYLPPTEYINVTRGSSFGVAFAINNPNPSGENYFEYEFIPDSSTISSCGVSEKTAKGWISMGHKSFGKIQKGWIDKMTVYFIFTDVSKPCTAKYNFNLKKDGQIYYKRSLVFNLV